jgi:hypothetical protein
MKAGHARAIALAFTALALAAAAQSPGGQRRARPEGSSPQERPTQDVRPLQAYDPVIALERELPSLRTDLGLSEEQKAHWGPFERSVRDAAELSRQRAKKMLAPRPIDAPAPNAMGMIAALADDERQRADAMGDAAIRVRALYESLSAAQRSLFDRRVLLSQSEPLGTR